MVQSKTDRERQKLIADTCLSLVEVLLKDDDNKYCVDCDAKGPRWASWNLGVFLCIRCAGIHRNLGVHISRVKSVNLDAWTPEHVAYVQRMGNSRARAIYEANLPDDFRRPQTDTALESFIRAKYEHKKYIAQDYTDPGPPEPAFNVDEELKRIKEQKRSKLTSSSTANKAAILSVSETLSQESRSQPRPAPQQKQQQENLATPKINNGATKTNLTPKANKSALADLIDLDLGFNAPVTSTKVAASADLFAPAPAQLPTGLSGNMADLASIMSGGSAMTTTVPPIQNLSINKPLLSASFGDGATSTLTPATANITADLMSQTNSTTSQNIGLTSNPMSGGGSANNKNNILDLLDL